MTAAQKRGFGEEELTATGLARRARRAGAARSTGSAAGMIFPLATSAAASRLRRPRACRGEEGPKYLNSRRAAICRRAACSTACTWPRPAIAKRHRAIVVEGYTDVIALAQAGFEEAVAAMGTAADRARTCASCAGWPNAVLLCFDADAAGQEAALRGMELAERSGLRVRVVALPPGSDPADILARGPEAVRPCWTAQPVLAFRVGARST